MSDVQILISAVTAEFGVYRERLRHRLERPSVSVKVQEDFIATGTPTLDMLDDYVKASDVVVHLVGVMTGAPASPACVAALARTRPDVAQNPVVAPFLQPDSESLSYTQWEAWLAVAHDKKLIIARAAPTAPRGPRYEPDDRQRAAQQVHLARLAQAGRHVSIDDFADEDSLVALTLESGVLEVLVEAGIAAEQERRPAQPVNVVRGVSPSFNEPFLDKHFRDRAQAREDAGTWLRDDGVRLICIWGRTGAGRTRLVEKVIRESESVPIAQGAPNDHPVDGAVMISAMSRPGEAKTPDVLVEELMNACIELVPRPRARHRLMELCAGSAPLPQKLSALLDELDSGSYLVAIDDVDCLLDESGWIRADHAALQEFIAAVVERRNGPHVIVTSQRPLTAGPGVAEVIRHARLESGLPEEDAIARLKDLDGSGVLGLRDTSDDELLRIVEVTHGLPKALDLVYGLLVQRRSLSLQDLSRHFLDEEQVVHALTEERLRNLDPKQARVVSALAVFGHPVPLQALQQVLSPWMDTTNCNIAVDSLIAIGLIDTSGRGGKIELDPLDRDLLSQGPDSAPSDDGFSRRRLHARAADYYAGLPERLPPAQWRQPQDALFLLWECDQRLAGEEYVHCAELLDAADYSWSHHHKFLAFLLQMGHGRRLVALRESLHGHLPAHLEARNLAAQAWVCRRLGESARALDILNLALALAERDGDAVGIMFARVERAFLRIDRIATEADAVMPDLEAVRGMARQGGWRYWEGMAGLGMAYSDFENGADRKALRHAQEALEAFQAAGAPLRVIDALTRSGMIHRKLGQYPTALKDSERAWDEACRIDCAPWQAETHSAFAFHYRGMGRYDKALKYHTRSIDLYGGAARSLREEGVQRSYRAHIRLELGAFDEALDDYRAALELVRSIMARREESWILGGLGTLMVRLGCHAAADAMLVHAVEMTHKLSDVRSKVIRLTDLAWARMVTGAFASATDLVVEALQLESSARSRCVRTALPEVYTLAPWVGDTLPHEMQSPGDHVRRGLILGRCCLQTGQLALAESILRAAGDVKPVAENLVHRALLLGAIVAHRTGDVNLAGRQYRAAIEASRRWIEANDVAPIEARITFLIARAGQALIDSVGSVDTVARHCADEMAPIRHLLGRRGIYDDVVALASCLPDGGSPLLRLLEPYEPEVPGEGACGQWLAGLAAK